MADLDVRALEAQLRTTVAGDVRFGGGSRALYATDASNYRQVPIGVVVPRSLDDVEAAVAACRDHGAPLVSRGDATSLAGQCCNAAVVIDWSKYLHHVIALDPDRKVARVEPGCVLDTLRAAARPHGLTFAPDPATHTHCTLGGMIGNNSCGVHSLLAGNFGFERGHWDISVACAERVLLPAARKADADTLMLTDGFSCRTQIEQLEGRGSVHIAEVLALALREGQPRPQPAPLRESPDGGRP